MEKEIQEMLNKGAIVEIPNHSKGEFISNLFLVEKNTVDGQKHEVRSVWKCNKDSVFISDCKSLELHSALDSQVS